VKISFNLRRALDQRVFRAPRSCPAASVPNDVAEYLTKIARFAADRIAALDSGEAIVKTAADHKGKVSMVGAGRIRTTEEHVQLYFDYVTHATLAGGHPFIPWSKVDQGLKPVGRPDPRRPLHGPWRTG
jgi:hypothetical protein